MTEAIRTDNREVVLGRSARHVLGRMGLTYGGQIAQAIRDQMARLSACHLRWAWERDGCDINQSGSFIMASITLHDQDESRGDVISDAVRLAPEFFDSLKKHAVPLSEEAVGALSYSPMSLDIYAWLGYRLHSLDRPTPVSWPAVASQFGPGYKALRQFRADFLPCLGAACAAYPDAKVELTDRGLCLYPSRPPISKIMIGLTRSGLVTQLEPCSQIGHI
jgi:hypothetical protein